MGNTLQFTLVFLLICCSCYGFLTRNIKFYEYGQHVDGEQMSYIYNGVIPGFKPIYQLTNVTSQKEELKPEFTYLRVEYYNLMSTVKVTYDPETFTLDFHIKFPFVDTLLGIMGYSMPI